MRVVKLCWNDFLSKSNNNKKKVRKPMGVVKLCWNNNKIKSGGWVKYVGVCL